MDSKQFARIIFLLIFWICVITHQSSASLVVYTSNTTIETGQYYFEGDDKSSVFESVSGLLADVSQTNLRNKIVYLPKLGDSFFLAEVQRIQSAGGIGVLYESSSAIPGRSGCALAAGTSTDSVNIPVAEIFSKDFKPIHKQILKGEEIFATLTSDGNIWTTTLSSVAVIVVFRVFLAGVAAGLIGYALYKLIMFIRVQGSEFNVPQVCLALEIIANLLRLVYFVVDPFGCFGSFGFAFPLLTTISFPFDIATFVLITLYWYEAITDASIKVYPFLTRSRVAFFVFTIGFIAVVLTVSILGLVLDFEITFPLIIIFTGITVIFVIFYAIIVAKITNKIKSAQNVQPHIQQNIKEVNIKIILNGITRLLAIIPILVFIPPQINGVPVPHVIVSAFIYAFAMLDSWARIFLFKIPSASTSKKSAQIRESSDVPPAPTSTVEDIIGSEARG